MIVTGVLLRWLIFSRKSSQSILSVEYFRGELLCRGKSSDTRNVSLGAYTAVVLQKMKLLPSLAMDVNMGLKVFWGILSKLLVVKHCTKLSKSEPLIYFILLLKIIHSVMVINA